jgi:hypothetical protein
MHSVLVIRRLLVLAPIVASGIGCGGKASSSQPEPAVVFEDRLVMDEHDDKSPLGISPANLPAPGNCRVWYPGRLPAQQPPVESCARAESRAAANTWVLYRPREDPRLVHVRIIDPDSAGVILRVRVYDAARGTYLGTKQAKRVQNLQ